MSAPDSISAEQASQFAAAIVKVLPPDVIAAIAEGAIKQTLEDVKWDVGYATKAIAKDLILATVREKLAGDQAPLVAEAADRAIKGMLK